MKKILFATKKPIQRAHLLIASSALACLSSSTSWAAITKHTEPFISYTVKRGDTLQALASDLLVDPKKWNELARLNNLKNPNLIQPGFVFDVPRSLINFDKQPKLATSGLLLSANGSVTVNGETAVAGAAVPEGARVQTAASSSAVIKLSDGSKVQLMPRSLAEVITQHGYVMKDPSTSISTTWFSGAIRLVTGVLDIAANKLAQRKEPLNVVTPTSVVGVRGTQFRVAFEDPVTGVARTEVLEGKVRADHSKQGSGADIGGGFGVAVKPTEREIKVVALLPALPESALPAHVERDSEGAQALWTVGMLDGAASYRAELAQDLAFTQIVFDTKSINPAIDLAAAPNGIYFARVRGIDASDIEGYNAVRRIDIAHAPTRLIWVREVNIAATADFIPEGLMLRVNISAADTPRSLQIQIGLDAAMTQGLQSFPLDASGNVILKNIKAGERRFVRFTGASPEGVASSSPVLSFELPADWGTTVFGIASALQTLP
jgi:hypothetical protein